MRKFIRGVPPKRVGPSPLDLGERDLHTDGVKIPNPTSDYNIATKKYVDDIARKWAIFNGV